MKRILILLSGLAALLYAAPLALTSCVEDPFISPQEGGSHHGRHLPDEKTDPDDGREDKKDDTVFPGAGKYSDKVKARYFGDKYSKDTDDYVLYLYIGEYDEDGNFTDVGTEAAFDMLCPLTDGMVISAGTYTCTSDELSPYRFLDGVIEDGDAYPSFFYRQYSREKTSLDLIESGTVVVSGGADNYHIVATFTAGTDTYKWRYDGPIEFIDETSSGDEVPKDVTMDRFSRATVENLGAIWSDASDSTIPVDDWLISLYGENYDNDSEYVVIELLSERNATSLPTGKFTEFINVNTAGASAFTSGRIIGGYDDAGTAFGTWYCKRGTAWYAAVEGSLTIGEKDGIHTIDFAFRDTDETYGGSFSGKYSGKLETVESTSDEGSGPSAASSPSLRRPSSPSLRSTSVVRSQPALTSRQADSRRPMRNASAARSAAPER